MNVVLLIRALTPGGAERQAVLVARGLRARGHAVTVAVLYRCGSDLEAELLADGVALLDLGKQSRWDLVGPLRRLCREVEARSADVVYAFLPTANVLAALLWGARPRPAVVAGFRSASADRATHDWLGRILVGLERRLRRRFAAGIANSTAGAAARLAEGWTTANIHVVRNGLPADAPGFDASRRQRARQAWGAAPDQPVVGFAGRIDAVKGIEQLLAAVAALRSAGPKVLLVIAGGGNERYVATLAERARAVGLDPDVRFLGHLRDLQGFYSGIDVLCLPSRTEGCSNVLAEALAAGTPVVATRVGEAEALLPDPAWLARPGDATDLARALGAALAGNRPDRTALRRHILAALSVDRMLAQTEAVLVRAAGPPRAAREDNCPDPREEAPGSPPDVMVVTMVFPWPSEAFAGVEVRALRDCGARVRVRALRGRHPSAPALLADWRLADLDVTSTSAASGLRGLAFGLTHPLLLARGLGWLVAHGWRRPLLLARCLALAPRMLDVFRECRRRPPRALYLFWGHYPAWLGHLVLRWLPGVHVAQSLNAYDLLYRFPPSIALGRQAHSLWTITAANTRTLAEAGIEPDRIRVAARALDLGQLPDLPAARDPRQLVTVARLEANKGVDDVLRVVGALRAEGRPVRLTVIGEGPDHRRLVALARSLRIADVVEFTGGVGHAEVYARLATAGVFLLLSRSPAERLPNAAKEALASGCTCVLTRSPGLEELVGPLAQPLVVAPGDWEAAAACVRDVLDAPERYVADRVRGREHMLANFDARRVARTRLAVWTAGPEIQSATEPTA